MKVSSGIAAIVRLDLAAFNVKIPAAAKSRKKAILMRATYKPSSWRAGRKINLPGMPIRTPS